MHDKIKNLKGNDIRLVTKYRANPQKFASVADRATPIIEFVESLFPGVEFSEAFNMARKGITEIPKCKNCGKISKLNKSSYTYPEFCSKKCNIEYNGQHNAVSITIRETVYSSYPEASKASGIDRTTLKKMILSPKFPDYRFHTDHEETVKKILKDVDVRFLDDTFISEGLRQKSPLRWFVKQTSKHPDTIRMCLAAHGISELPNEQIPKAAQAVRDDKDTLELLYSRMTSEEIAIELKVTPKTVQNWLHSHEIKIDYSRSQSAVEREFLDWLSLNGVNAIARDKLQVGKEIDVYLPDHKIAIEFDGLRYHSECSLWANKERHLKLHRMCEEKGIQLLRFVDVDETSSEEKKRIIKSMILNKVGKSTRVYARNLTVRE